MHSNGRWSAFALRYALVAILLLVAQNVTAQGAATETGAPTVYVVRRGWHIDVGYAKRDLREPLRSIAENFPDATYVFFGFGDMHYLADARNQHGPAMLAALWPGRGIVLVTTLQVPPDVAFGSDSVIEFPADEQVLVASQAFIWNSLLSRTGGVDVYRTGPYEGSYYFLATPTYSAFNTCNTWAAQALRAAGYPIRARGVLFASQLWSQARRLRRHTQLQGGLVPS